MNDGMRDANEFADLAGKSVLVVEDECFLAVEMAEAVRRIGGRALGPVLDVAGAMAKAILQDGPAQWGEDQFKRR